MRKCLRYSDKMGAVSGVVVAPYTVGGLDAVVSDRWLRRAIARDFGARPCPERTPPITREEIEVKLANVESRTSCRTPVRVLVCAPPGWRGRDGIATAGPAALAAAPAHRDRGRAPSCRSRPHGQRC